MKLLICGSRGITDMATVERAIRQSGFEPTFIISGGARGIDTLAKNWAIKHSLPFQEYPADWDKYGKSAGYRRNEIMVSACDAVLAIWDGTSKGTKHSITLAAKLRKPCFVFTKGFGRGL